MGSYIELRLDWKAPGKKYGDEVINKVAIFRVVPWLAYGCGEGARLAVRKPGATESTASTLQRTLRDDFVVVRRDGSDNELTVDPTPFTVVVASNPRHPPGTRLLIVHEGTCVDAVVEPWPDGDIDIKEGSRHSMRVEGKHISGWVTLITKEGKVLIVRQCDEGEEGAEGASIPFEFREHTAAPEPIAEVDEENEGDEGEKTEEPQEEEIDKEEVWILNRKKALAIYSGCDSQNSEKLGLLTNKMPIRMLEKRMTEEGVLRGYVTTIPGQSNIVYTAALNEFNHSVQRASQPQPQF